MFTAHQTKQVLDINYTYYAVNVLFVYGYAWKSLIYRKIHNISDFWPYIYCDKVCTMCHYVWNGRIAEFKDVVNHFALTFFNQACFVACFNHHLNFFFCNAFFFYWRWNAEQLANHIAECESQRAERCENKVKSFYNSRTFQSEALRPLFDKPFRKSFGKRNAYHNSYDKNYNERKHGWNGFVPELWKIREKTRINQWVGKNCNQHICKSLESGECLQSSSRFFDKFQKFGVFFVFFRHILDFWITYFNHGVFAGGKVSLHENSNNKSD